MPRTVLQLIESFRRGGSEGQAVQLTRLLCESGKFDVRVATLNGGEGVLRDVIEELDTGEIPEFPLTSFYDRNMLAQTRRLARFLRREKIDLIHTHDFYANIFGMIAARLARVPVRVTVRRETNGMRSTMQRRVERTAYSVANAVIANAEAVRRQVIEEGTPAAKVHTIYNGLDMRRVAATPGASRGELFRRVGLECEPEREIVTIIANMRLPVKDHRMFLRMAARVHERLPRAAFALVGEGELAPELKAYAAELGLGAHAHFPGGLDAQQVAAALAASSVCVLTSRGEGFSNAALEYMAANRAVVITDVGGAREVVTDGVNGFIVAPGDDAGMAERVVALLEDACLRAQVARRGQQTVAEKFSCAQQLRLTEELYERLFDSRGM